MDKNDKQVVNAPKAGMTKYDVAFDSMGRNVEILLNGQGASEGYSVIGSFEADVVNGKVKGDSDNPHNASGGKLLIALAREVVQEAGDITDFSNVHFHDRASNAPTGHKHTLTTNEVEGAVRQGEDPATKQAEQAEKLDKAEDKHDQKRDKGTVTKK